jgi:predicted nucleotidyltransferase
MAVSFGVIFGSQVTGRTDRWSDIDLIVVSPRFDEPYTRDDRFLLWHVAGAVDNRIEPIACGERQWREDDVSTIIEVARREGERVALPARRPPAGAIASRDDSARPGIEASASPLSRSSTG